MDPQDENVFGTEDAVTDTAGTDNINPAWQELYQVLPDNLHVLAKPVLDKWEQETQGKFQRISEAQKAYEPYKEFVDQGIPADQLSQAYEVMNLINTDPQGFLAQMQAFYGGDNSQQQQPQQQQQKTDPDSNADYASQFDEAPFNLAETPEYKQLKQQQDVIAGFLAAEVEKKEQEAADAFVENQLNELKEKYGEYDEQYVVGLAVNGIPLEEGVKRYQALVNSIRNTPAAQDSLPSIMSPGGGTPSEQINPAEMSAEQRKAFVMNALAQANNNG